MPKPLRIFFMELIIRFIHLHRLSQGENDKVLRHVLFLEEIHNLFQKNKYEKDKIDSLENVYREIRSFGQGLVSITQHPSLLPTYVLGNSRTLIFLALQHQDDIEAARKALFLPRDDEAYLNMLKTGQGIVKIMERINPCVVQFLYVPVEKGAITDEWLKINNHGFLPRSHDEKSNENPCFLPGDNSREEDKGKKVKNHEQGLFIDIFQNPLSGISQRYKRLGINPKFGNEHKNVLISQGLIQPESISLRDCRIILFEITAKGKAALRDLGYEVKDTKESVIHKFWKFRIADYYKNKGYEIMIEEIVNGKPDIIIMNKNKKIAVEIETGNSDAVFNVKKNLKAFDEIVCIATNKEVQQKITEDLKEMNLQNKATITSVLAFPLN